MVFQSLPVGVLGVNCYIVGDKNEAIVIDPGANSEKICTYLDEHDVKVKYIVLTHCHFDHVLATLDVRDKTGSQIIICSREKDNFANDDANFIRRYNRKPMDIIADWYVSEGDVLLSGNYAFRVIETPGHTVGSMCLYCEAENMLFAGDTLFYQSVGRTDLLTGDYASIISSIKTKLLILPDSTKVFPGHGEPTTIQFEKANNPYLTER